MGKLQEYLKNAFGFPTTTRISTATLSATPSQVLQSNPNRVGWIIVNTGANAAYLNFESGGVVSATNGIALAVAGGSASTVARDDGELPGLAVFGVETAGATTLYILETLAER
jgi:hypothetical protein